MGGLRDKWRIGAVVALASGAVALQGCGRDRDTGSDQSSAETQVAPPMANVTAPPPPKPVVAAAPKPAVTVPAAATTAPDAQMSEDAAASGMTARTTSTTTTTVTTHTQTGPAGPPQN